MAEAKAKVSSQNVQSNICLTFADILEALDILKGAVSIVYPMGLPEYDPIRMEMENREELAGTQAQVRKPQYLIMTPFHIPKFNFSRRQELFRSQKNKYAKMRDFDSSKNVTGTDTPSTGSKPFSEQNG